MKALIFIQIRENVVEENTLGILNKLLEANPSIEIHGTILGNKIKE